RTVVSSKGTITAEMSDTPRNASLGNESEALDEDVVKSVILTDKMTGGDSDVDVFINNIWTYILGIGDEMPPTYEPKLLLSLLEKAERILEEETTVLDLQVCASIHRTLSQSFSKQVRPFFRYLEVGNSGGPLTVIGDLQGHGDSLLTLISLTSQSSNQRFLFLGNYSGCGFAPHESLFLLLALKLRYPHKIFLLKGNMEDPENAKAHFFIEGLAVRNLMTTALVWLACERIFGLLPLAALVAGRLFCVHGGIGEYTVRYGIPTIRRIQRPPLMPLEVAITKELVWGCLHIGAEKKLPSMDNVPLFDEKDIETFCERNSVEMIIRSRQLTSEGILNNPSRLFTIWSAVSFLDNFNNAAAALVLDASCRNATVISYSLYEPESKSLDDTKPAGGRSTLALQ
uniref:Serine/threonine specific protein phosphatases domain-containing protein n=1 Tax=Parascaris univalens TaxID=6257 RepID=A0A915AAA8_PARUN